MIPKKNNYEFKKIINQHGLSLTTVFMSKWLQIICLHEAFDSDFFLFRIELRFTEAVTLAFECLFLENCVLTC